MNQELEVLIEKCSKKIETLQWHFFCNFDPKLKIWIFQGHVKKFTKKNVLLVCILPGVGFDFSFVLRSLTMWYFLTNQSLAWQFLNNAFENVGKYQYFCWLIFQSMREPMRSVSIFICWLKRANGERGGWAWETLASLVLEMVDFDYDKTSPRKVFSN